MKPRSEAPRCPGCGHRIVVQDDRFVIHYPASGHVPEGAEFCVGSLNTASPA